MLPHLKQPLPCLTQLQPRLMLRLALPMMQ
jgi:hypothetical protein